MNFDANSLLPLLGPAIGLAFILLRSRRLRVIHVRRLWVVPSLLLLAAAAALTSQGAPPLMLILGLLAATAVGVAAGLWRGGQKRLAFDDAGRIVSRSSPVEIAFLLFVVLLRTASRQAGVAADLPVDPIVLTDVMLAFMVGLVCAERYRLYRRCRALPLFAQG